MSITNVHHQIEDKFCHRSYANKPRQTTVLAPVIVVVRQRRGVDDGRVLTSGGGEKEASMIVGYRQVVEEKKTKHE
ncbi:hypothetical protein AMTR_s00001p00260620 [Amborella trichopoda]|uniref:Uncharacterized protein n=1 Tax=Amborella trichopoda TaxID=13333 RepID=W1NMJ7_AMBTC|nr:hypothetical protein AMTR_s00001p00260620 [Amborella trichopoda]